VRARLMHIALAVGCVGLLPAAVFGQGAIGGVVRDSSGGVLPGVTVEATSPALIERVRTAVTDNNGQYLIVDLRPGVYSVAFTLTGFTTLKREGLELSTGVTLPINADLKVGAIEETVIVTSQTPVVDIKSTRQQTVLTRDLLDVIPRTRLQQLTATLLPGVVLQGAADVGGATSEPVTNLSIHGGDHNDQIWAIDGMKITEGGAGARRILIVADNTVQEYTYETSAFPAEIPTGGIRMNLVPKEGGNRFKGIVSGDFTTRGMVSNNLSAKLRDRGLTSTDGVNKIWDISPALGGPVLGDRLWFFTTFRHWGSSNLPADAFYLFDPTRRAIDTSKFWTANGRLTWQATKRNKFNLYHDLQNRERPYAYTTNLLPPEVAVHHYSRQIRLTQAKWNSPLTSRLLLEASAYRYFHVQVLDHSPASRLTSWVPEQGPDPTAWPTIELTTGKWIGGSYVTPTPFPGTLIPSWWGESGAISYITGTHAFKVGFTHVRGLYLNDFPPVPPILRLLDGVPFQVQLVSKPAEARNRVNHDLGLYAQDQWTLDRLTLNLGLRFDYFNGQVDAQYAPAGRWFLPERRLPEIRDVPDWKDISPRFGLAYDIFGDGKTAVKTSLSRYIKSEATNFQGSVNPMGSTFTAGLTDTRTWTDSNGDRIPEVDELGPSTNLAYGLPVLTTRPDDKLREGWGVRGNNWEYAASIQRELLPGLSLTAAYFRRWFGNLVWTDNLLVQETDYVPFTLVSPLTGEQITQYNLDPAKRGLFDGLLTMAPQDTQVFNGVDLLVNGRFGRGGLVNGGVSMGRTVTETCTTYNPNARRFCRVTPPFMAGNQYKFMAAYPLPYSVQFSGTFLSIPGPLIMANYTFSSAVAEVPLTLGSLSVNLVEPGTLYGDRSNRVDLRFSKNLRVGATRWRPNIDFLNVFNASPVLTLNNTYGPAWQRPTTIQVGRMIKLGMQVDF
jgi:carboxypeptidase family protein